MTETPGSEVLATVTFNLTKDVPSTEFLKKLAFPVAVPPKSSIIHDHRQTPPLVLDHDGKQVDFLPPKSSVPRPRNKFIIARTILSKVVKTHYDGSTDDVSKIISKIWSSGQGNFQDYFNYLSFMESQWHECYYPSYQFTARPRQISPKAFPMKQNSKKNYTENVSVIMLNSADATRQQTVKRTSPKSDAIDIKDMRRYVQLCCSSYENSPSETGTPPLPPVSSSENTEKSYRKHTMILSLGKKKRDKSSKQTGGTSRVTKKKPAGPRKTAIGHTKSTDFIISKFNSPLYGEVEDICLNDL